MRYFLRRYVPQPTRILLVESGSRHLIENLLPVLRRSFGAHTPIDIVTCYEGAPAGFHPETSGIFNVNDYRGRAGRRRLYRELAKRRHGVAGIVCSGEQVLMKWKWALAARVRAKIFIVNENGDYFWLDYSAIRTVRHFIALRAGLTDAGAVRTIARLLLFPFTLAYLLLFAAAVHLKRILRTA